MSSAKLRTSSGTAVVASRVACCERSARSDHTSQSPIYRLIHWQLTRADWSPGISCLPDSFLSSCPWYSVGSRASGAGSWWQALPSFYSAWRGARVARVARPDPRASSGVVGGATVTSPTTTRNRPVVPFGGDGASYFRSSQHLPRRLQVSAALAASLALLLAACDSTTPTATVEEETLTDPLGRTARIQDSDRDDESMAAPTAALTPQQSSAPELDPVTRAAGFGKPQPFDFDHALGVLRHLAVEIGPRAQTTAAERAAADYIAEQFRSFGYEVEIQPFPLLIAELGEAALSMNGQSIPTRAFAGSVGGAVSGPLIVIPGLGAEADYAGVDVSGAVVLVERGELFFQDKITNAQIAGAAAIVIYNNEPGLFDGALSNGTTIPAIAIAREDGLTLKSSDRTDAVVTVEGGSEARESQNVIARTVGGRCEIYVGGHYDTVPAVAGANDNASGTALVVELARAYYGSEGAAVVCFVAFGAEEGGNGSRGLDGSRFLAQQIETRGEAKQVRAMLNLDAAAAGNSIMLVGSPLLTTMGLPLARSLTRQGGMGPLPPGVGSDHLSFDMIDIPVIFPFVSGATIHVPSDNFMNIEWDLFADLGALAYGLLRCLIAQEGRSPLSGEACLDLNTAA